MKMGIFPLWLLVGGCSVALGVPTHVAAVCTALGIALTLAVVSRQSNFLSPALFAAIPLVGTMVVSTTSGQGENGMTAILSVTSTPTCFFVCAFLSCATSWMLGVKWVHTGKA